ncbi:hypothetical protein EXN66_Car001170 [Channa argus]|uniref:Uncharacterized protein n=1 Tax=Channa argus TaxID=215402 RepID=A0A6G1QZW2_CHAAH|nr:hypothetical protein EXN66_Car001170 [Channa argus]
MSCHVLNSQHTRTLADNNTKGKKINKERKGSKIKINTNRKGEQLEAVEGETRGVKSWLAVSLW